MAFTSAQLVDIRRFCGYEAYGSQYTPASGYRFFAHYGRLEYRIANLTSDEQNVVTNTYLANLYTLETAIVGTSANLDTDEAAIWKHNKNEQRDREALFDSWRRRLCSFLGVPPGEGLAGSGTITLTV